MEQKINKLKLEHHAKVNPDTCALEVTDMRLYGKDLRQYKGKNVYLSFRLARNKRSVNQNNSLWMILTEICVYLNNTGQFDKKIRPIDLKKSYAEALLPTNDFINVLTGEVTSEISGTSGLLTDVFSEFFDNIRKDALQRWGIETTEPDPEKRKTW